MANNRMYLVNVTTGVSVCLGKYYPSTGWFTSGNVREAITEAFSKSDFGHLTQEEQEAKAAQIGFGAPYAQGGMYGDDWTLEFEGRYTDESAPYSLDLAIRTAQLWRDGKMIGGAEDAVRNALLAEVERLHAEQHNK